MKKAKASVYEVENLNILYQKLAGKDKYLEMILRNYGYPPIWVRSNSFETLVLIILGQQVSLASAYAAFKKLKEKISVTPAALLQLSDQELRSCYLSKQKIQYTRALANAILDNQINLEELSIQPEDMVRRKLKNIKGIGDWTIDIYLIHALKRIDVFPTGDLALVNAIKMIKEVPAITKEELIRMSLKWKPYRSLATLMFWHYYIKKKGIKFLH